jgi:hypothetical protein
MAFLEADRGLHWSILQRGFWTNGASELSEWIAEMDRWTLTPELLGRITCPVLVLSAEGDRASTTTDDVLRQLTTDHTHIHFGPDDGAAQHCEMLNRPFANRTILDWLDRALAGSQVERPA